MIPVLFIENLDIEEVALLNGLNKVLAEDVYSKINNPPFNKSAMDGYALIAEDAFINNKIKVIDKVYAGGNSNKIITKNTAIKIINSTTQKENTYKFEGVIKEMYCSGSKIALNLGSEIHFVDTNGWLIKKYTSNQEVRKIVISNEVAGIIYRNKIELIKL